MASPVILSPLNAIIAALLSGQIVFQQGDIDKPATATCALAANRPAPPSGGFLPPPPPPSGGGPPPPATSPATTYGTYPVTNENLTRSQIGNFFEKIQANYSGASNLLTNYTVGTLDLYVQTPAVGTQFVVLSLPFRYQINSVELALDSGALTYDLIDPNTGSPLGAPGILATTGSPLSVAVCKTAKLGGTLAVLIRTVAAASGLTINFNGKQP